MAHFRYGAAVAAGLLCSTALAGTHRIDPKRLPPPYATQSADNGPHLVARPPGAALHAPPGFHVAEWAGGLRTPRVMAVAPNGDVFVSEHGPGRVVVLRDSHGQGRPDVRSVFASHLTQPFGLAFYPPGPRPRFLYVANIDSVVRYPYRAGDLTARGPAQTVVPHLPGYGYHQHWTRRIVFRPDGRKMYVSVGSKSNVGVEEARRAAILEFNPDGSGPRVYASGLRNAVGLAFNPVSGALWAAVNERDGLGDDLPPDYVTSVRPGGFYGWPYFYIGAHPDRRVPARPQLASRVIVPDVLLQAHSAALSVLFYTGIQFPPAYRNQAFVGLHGSWNRAKKTGYKVVLLPFGPDGKARGDYQDFVWGWETPRGQVWGRPVDVAQMRDGSLLISDDGGGRLWRVTYLPSR
ncbi:MAG: sorbosone dehydrogenase family protein [Armatimonadetes bacterium]|nr:sorbosone dehydrogenase family protein [Armatimonadota bacterium]